MINITGGLAKDMSVIKDIISRFKGEETIGSLSDGKNTISITENRGTKSLKFNGWVYSRFNEKEIYTYSYWDYFIPLPALYDSPKILMIGLGGGTIIRQFLAFFKGNFRMDVVEINKEVIALSKKFFGELPENVRIINDDGAEFIKKAKGEYQIVILDAYDDINIPQVFLQQEFIDDACNALSSDGVLGINYALLIKAMLHLDGFTKRLKSRFDVYTLNYGLNSGNMMILCSKKMKKEEIQKKAAEELNKLKGAKHILDCYLNMSSK